jgi:hypothetical protein
MTTVKHTPGPWKAVFDIASMEKNEYEKYSTEHCWIQPVNGGDHMHLAMITNWNREANAKLIAAAPELLENLERLVSHIEENGLQNNFTSAFERALAAIKNATE